MFNAIIDIQEKNNEIKELAIVILILITKIKNYIKLCLKFKAKSEII